MDEHQHLKLSLPAFIRSVKEQLIAAESDDKPFYYLEEVSLEVSFALDATIGGGVKLWVVDAKGDVKRQQTHKVTVKLKPLEGPPAYICAGEDPQELP
ncbi:hypothetical protein QF000_006485 [Paraburkholderia atlantica]|uniref:trypco2 family protein n=1 Tax=Paraburkholderia atlantica TaxID=2654982 RepID=UPI003D1BAE7D